MRVLAINGGGIRGYLPALMLREIERRAGQPAGDLFDLVVGTSTGGIIGIGLATGRPANELADFYPRYGTAIFGGSDSVSAWKRRLIGPTGNFWADYNTALRRFGSIFGGNAQERSLDSANYYRLQVVDSAVAGSMDDPSSQRLSELAAAASRMISQESSKLDQIVGRLTDHRQG